MTLGFSFAAEALRGQKHCHEDQEASLSQFQIEHAEHFEQAHDESNENSECADPCHVGRCHFGHCVVIFQDPALPILSLENDKVRYFELSSLVKSPSLEGLRRPPRSV